MLARKASSDEIARLCRMSVAAVNDYIRRHNLRSVQNQTNSLDGVSSKTVKNIIWLRRSGLAVSEICRKLEISIHQVQPVIVEQRLTVPTPRERKEILARIHYAREASRLSITDLARKIRYRRAVTELFVDGTGLMRYLSRIGAYCRVSYDWLLWGQRFR
jgi:DNA-binding CsgD family transcriptional regulator